MLDNFTKSVWDIELDGNMYVDSTTHDTVISSVANCCGRRKNE